MSHNFHEDLTRPAILRRTSDRSFGFALTAVLMAAGLWPLSHHRVRVWPLFIGAAFLVVTLMRPALLSLLTRTFSAAGLLLSRITNPIVTALLFLIVFTPVGLISRILGRDPMRRNHAPEAGSYWIARTPPGPRPETMSKQF
jgi:hypothetical protein